MSNINDFVIEKGYLGDPDAVVLKKYTGTDLDVEIPDGVTMLEWYSFKIPITSIKAPKTLSRVDPRAFVDSGASLADDDGFCTVGHHLINYVGNTEVIHIPEGIKSIEYCAFRRNETLKRVMMPDSIEVIGNQSFAGCTALEEIRFSENAKSLQRIKFGAFSGCESLRSIDLPDSVTAVEGRAFSGCRNLRVDSSFLILGKVLVAYYGEDESVVVPDGIALVADDAFKERPVKHVVFPDSLRHIGDSAFFMNKTLVSVTVPDTMETIGAKAFCCCENLKSINLTGVKKIGQGAFSHCTCLAPPVFSEGLTEIGDEAFAGCNQITRVSFPSTLKQLGHDTAHTNDPFFNGAFSGTGIETVVLPDALQVLGRNVFSNCCKLKKIVIPGNVRTIGSGAFYQCSALGSVEIAEGVEVIAQEAFRECSALKSITIPESVTEIRSNAFLRCPHLSASIFSRKMQEKGGEEFLADVGLGDENGCIVKNATLVCYVGEPGIIHVTDGVERISKSVFSHLFTGKVSKKTTRIILPDTVKYFDESILGYQPAINIPKGYFRQKEKLPAAFTLSLLKCQWRDQVTARDYAYILLFQGGKDLIQLCREEIAKDPQRAAEAFVDATALGMKNAEYVKAAEFIFEHKDKIGQETLDAFYVCAVNAKAQKAADLLKPITAVEKSTPDTSENAAAQHPIEGFCETYFVGHYLDKALKKAGLSEKPFERVLYKGSGKKAPAFVVKCAIAPYIALMEERPKRISEYKTAYLPVSFIENADKVAAELDSETFIQALEKIARLDSMGYDKPQRLIPLCRYGNEDHIKTLVSKMKQWESWSSFGASGRSAVIVARGAIMLNDSRAAMIYIDKCGAFSTYAKMRGQDEDVLRDTKLADFGLDSNGCKFLDLGNTVIEVSVGQDLSVCLYDTQAHKTVKSLPKKGADADKHAAASVELSDLKKNLKKVVKVRNDILFERFLDGREQDATAWSAAYTKNPILHRVAELIVWTQENNTFILTKNGAVDCNGNIYLISDGSPVGVAHPKDMTKAEVVAWQKYFTSHGLKQPFEQIWEPVIDRQSIRPDRYKGYMIPFFRFKDREKHGIYIQNFHERIRFSFEGCDAHVEGIDLRNNEINMNDRFEIRSFSVSRLMTRKVNHVVAYLDRISAYGCILNDDASVGGMLPMFTLAQIMEFINAASENNCTNVLAVLMDYKNRTFVDFDPMEEFSLDL